MEVLSYNTRVRAPSDDTRLVMAVKLKSVPCIHFVRTELFLREAGLEVGLIFRGR